MTGMKILVLLESVLTINNNKQVQRFILKVDISFSFTMLVAVYFRFIHIDIYICVCLLKINDKFNFQLLKILNVPLISSPFLKEHFCDFICMFNLKKKKTISTNIPLFDF